MGKHKTQRADRLRKADNRRMWGDYVLKAIEQHNFDRLVAQDVIIEGGASEKGIAPQVPGRGYSHSKPRNIT